MIPDVASLSLAELRQEWRARFKEAPPAFRSRDLLARALVHRLEGGTPPRLKKRLTELAQRFSSDPEYSPIPKNIAPLGGALVRDWNGRRYVVLRTEAGFQVEDKTYRSLTEVAKAITGRHQSGPRFFGLAK